MDIRKYFGGSNKSPVVNEPKTRRNEISDTSDEEPLPESLRNKQKKRKNYKVSSDSDEEPILNLKKSMKTYGKPNGDTIKHIKKSDKRDVSTKSKEIEAAAYFDPKKLKKNENVAKDDLSIFATTDAEREEITPVLSATIPTKSKAKGVKEVKKVEGKGKDKSTIVPKVNKKESQTDNTITTKTGKINVSKPKTFRGKKPTLADDDEDYCVIEDEIISSPIKKRKNLKKDLTNEKEDVLELDDSKDEGSRQDGKKAAYHAFINRGGPQALGSKPLPQGRPNCLEGMTFVISGVLDSIERDTAKDLIEQYGGKVTQALSKKTSYLVAGREPGASKISKAQSLGTPQIDEDKLFKLISSQPEKESKYMIYKPLHEKDSPPVKKDSPKSQSNILDDHKIKGIHGKMNKKVTWRMNNNEDEVECITETNKSAHTTEKDFKPTAIIKNHSKDKISLLGKNEDYFMWVDKYKPKITKEIIGQQGDKSSLHKLIQWLGDWFYNHSKSSALTNGVVKASVKKGGFGGNQDPSQFKAALLSGSPGVGKTTSAILACKELGFTYSELNASNIRSKKCLKDLFSDSLSSYNIPNFLKGVPSNFRSHVLIMDEVDGMAGNEDRGGIQELIALIKTTKLPIICICNQRSDPKMRTLVNYCYDLRFPKPRLEQIKEAMMAMLFKEKIQIEPAVVQQVIQASNNDIRQVIHSLSLLSSDNKSLKYHTLAPEIKCMKKDIKLDDFEITRNIFAPTSSANSNPLIEKSDLFFMDYSAVPLFIQENYLQVQTFAANKCPNKQLDLLSQAADSISCGDLISTAIQKNNNWTLLPLSAIATTVAPGEILKGYCGGMINFPSWFGKNSKRTKFLRMLKELKMHTTLRTYSDWQDIDLDYLPSFKTILSSPLISNEVDRVDEVIKIMTYYYLQKEDVDNVMEMSRWGSNSKDPFSQLNTKIKSALTRSFNKLSPMIPYSLSQVEAVRKSSRKITSTSHNIDDLENGDNDYSDGGNDDDDGGNGSETDPDFDFKSNKMIKKKNIKQAIPKKNLPTGKEKRK